MVAPHPLAAMPGPRTPSTLQVLQWLGDPDYCVRMARRYGPTFRLHFPFWGDVAAFTTAAAGREVLRLPSDVAHSGMSVMTEAVGDRAILVLNGDDHTRVRRTLTPFFAGSRVRNLQTLIEQRTRADIRSWPLRKPFAIRPIAERITLDVIGTIVFGGADTPQWAELRAALPALYDWNSLTAFGFTSPRARIDLGPLSPWGRYRRAREHIDRLLYSEIDRRRRADDGPDDLLSALVAQDGLSDKEIRDQLVAMLIAGHETTSTSIAWVVAQLARRPDVVDRIRLSPNDEYLDAVIKETLRLHPPTQVIPRLLAQDTVLDGWALPAGTTVGVVVNVLQRSPQTYPNPDAFDPDRFLGAPGPDGWLPFGDGYRRCPGGGLAMLEIRGVVSTIVQHCDFRADRPRPERPRMYHVVTVPARGGRIIVDAFRE